MFRVVLAVVATALPVRSAEAAFASVASDPTSSGAADVRSHRGDVPDDESVARVPSGARVHVANARRAPEPPAIGGVPTVAPPFQPSLVGAPTCTGDAGLVARRSPSRARAVLMVFLI